MFAYISISISRETSSILLALKKCAADYKVLLACVQSFILIPVTLILIADKSFRPASWRLGVRIPVATVVKTGSGSSTAKRSAIGVGVKGPRSLLKDAPCHSRCGTQKNLHCSIAMSAEHRTKFAVLHSNGDVSIWVKNSRQTTQ